MVQLRGTQKLVEVLQTINLEKYLQKLMKWASFLLSDDDKESSARRKPEAPEKLYDLGSLTFFYCASLHKI